MEQRDNKRWFVVTWYGKFETIIKDRAAWETKGYTYSEKGDEVILSK